MQYYKAKGMNPDQIATFIEERKWDYRGTTFVHQTPMPYCIVEYCLCVLAFGFAAALAERLPIIGLVFSVSNRIGAAMWAHGELRMHSLYRKSR